MDDLITSSVDVKGAYKFYIECKRIKSAGGMNLRKWHSNSLELLGEINSIS